jgi:hypothetical protein
VLYVTTRLLLNPIALSSYVPRCCLCVVRGVVICLRKISLHNHGYGAGAGAL